MGGNEVIGGVPLKVLIPVSHGELVLMRVDCYTVSSLHMLGPFLM